MMCATQLLMQMAGAGSPAWSAPAPPAGKDSTQETSPSFQTLLQQRQDHASQETANTGDGTVSAQSPAEDGLTQESENNKDSQTVSMDLAALGAALLANGISQIQPEACGSAQTQETVQSIPAEMVFADGESAPSAGSALVPEQTAVPQAGQPSGTEQDVQMTEQPVQVQVPEGPVQAERSSPDTRDDAFAAGQDQQNGATSRREDSPQVTDHIVSWETPLFQQTEQVPVKVGETTKLDATISAPQLEQDLGKILESGLEDGAQRLEIQLSPANLGTVTAEFVRSPEGALHVVLRAENSQAAKLLGDHAGALGLLLQEGNHGEVRVEVPQPQHDQQTWQQPDQNGGRQQQQQQQPRRTPRQETDSFLHQLRLGLVEAEKIM